mmetsp:Transcript_3977/g.14810  ORF Transcript_3977/g.14810 Transcript_3977/m.14810 type:complete len:482 (-) Transcript_3977:691-2136(-)
MDSEELGCPRVCTAPWLDSLHRVAGWRRICTDAPTLSKLCAKLVHAGCAEARNKLSRVDSSSFVLQFEQLFREGDYSFDVKTHKPARHSASETPVLHANPSSQPIESVPSLNTPQRSRLSRHLNDTTAFAHEDHMGHGGAVHSDQDVTTDHLSKLLPHGQKTEVLGIDICGQLAAEQRAQLHYVRRIRETAIARRTRIPDLDQNASGGFAALERLPELSETQLAKDPLSVINHDGLVRLPNGIAAVPGPGKERPAARAHRKHDLPKAEAGGPRESLSQPRKAFATGEEARPQVDNLRDDLLRLGRRLVRWSGAPANAGLELAFKLEQAHGTGVAHHIGGLIGRRHQRAISRGSDPDFQEPEVLEVAAQNCDCFQHAKHLFECVPDAGPHFSPRIDVQDCRFIHKHGARLGFRASLLFHSTVACLVARNVLAQEASLRLCEIFLDPASVRGGRLAIHCQRHLLHRDVIAEPRVAHGREVDRC